MGTIYHYRATYLQQGGIDVSRMADWKLDPARAGAAGHGEPFHPNFDDGLRVQRVLDAVVRSAGSRSWQKC